MSTQSFFDRLVGRKREREKTALTSYQQLVESIVTEAGPDPDEVEWLLAESGKSIDDLRRDVQRCQHRMELKAVVASLPELDRESADVQKRIAAADRELEVAEQKHDEATGPLYARLEEIKQARSDASRARQELFHTCEDPELEQQLDHANAELQWLLEANKDLATHAAWLDNKSDAERERADKELSGGDREHRREQAALYRKQAESLRRQIKANQKAQADAVKQREQIEDRMRQW